MLINLANQILNKRSLSRTTGNREELIAPSAASQRVLIALNMNYRKTAKGLLVKDGAASILIRTE